MLRPGTIPVVCFGFGVVVLMVCPGGPQLPAAEPGFGAANAGIAVAASSIAMTAINERTKTKRFTRNLPLP